MGVGTVEALWFAWEHRVVPLLREYFHNDPWRLRAVLGEAFVEAVPVEAGLFDAGAAESIDPDDPPVRLRALGDDESFLNALRRLAEAGPSGARGDEIGRDLS